ncbi:MAG: ABC transporter permease, partial [Bacteroidota bacterium]
GVGKAVTSENTAKKYFGKTDAVGEKFEINQLEYTITAVIEDLPPNVHHRLDILLSIQSMGPKAAEMFNAEFSENYWRPSCFHFIMLGENNSIEEIEKGFPAFFNAHMDEFGKRLNATFGLILTPLPDVHFTSGYSYDYPKGSRSYIYLFIAAGIFIFFIATLNYTSLFSSSLTARVRSLGIYKINGAIGQQVYKLLISESIIVILASVLISIFLITAFNTYTNELIVQAPLTTLISSRNFIWFLLIILGFLAMAFIIPIILRANRNPVNLIKGENVRMHGKKFPIVGRGSVILQFSLSVILIISSLIITRQVRYMLSADVGYNSDNILQIKMHFPQTPPEKIVTFKQELLKSPLVRKAAFSSNIPGEPLGTVYFDLDKGGTKESRIISLIGIDKDYISLMEMKLSQGRNFNPDISTNNNRVIILNEAGVEFLGLGDSIAGTILPFNDEINIEIIGVTESGKYNPLHEESKPIAFHPDISNRGYMNVKLNTSDLHSAIEYIETVYNEFFEDFPFQATFMDETVENMYREDINQSKLLGLFTVLSIILANIGLFGLVSLMSRKKTKEIGIRKVNGAQSWQIVLRLNRELLLWVFIAVIIATPFTIYLMDLWLKNFASRVEFRWWIIPVGGIVILLTALLTTSWITFRAANKNPVETLRYE